MLSDILDHNPVARCHYQHTAVIWLLPNHFTQFKVSLCHTGQHILFTMSHILVAARCFIKYYLTCQKGKEIVELANSIDPDEMVIMRGLIWWVVLGLMAL